MNSSPPPPGGSARSLEGSGNFDSTPGNNLRPHSSASRLETIGGETTGGHSWSPLDHDEYSVDPEVRKRENVRSSGRQSGVEEVTYHMTAVEGDSLEDSYYLIDTNPQFPVGVDVPGNKYLDVNALASKLASLEVRQHGGSGAPGGENSDPLQGATGGGGISREGLTGFTEVALEGGSAHSVKVKVEKKGTAVAWEFMSEPKGLAFSLSFEEVEGAKTEQVSIFLSFLLYHFTLFPVQWRHQSFTSSLPFSLPLPLSLSLTLILSPSSSPSPDFTAASLCLPQGDTLCRIRGSESRQLHSEI